MEKKIAWIRALDYLEVTQVDTISFLLSCEDAFYMYSMQCAEQMYTFMTDAKCPLIIYVVMTV